MLREPLPAQLAVFEGRVRPFTIPDKRVPKEQLRIGRFLYPEKIERPRTRGECPEVRPCPFVGCRYNLFLEDARRSEGLKFPWVDLEPWDVPPQCSCALDVAERGGLTLDQTGGLLNITRERVRQIEDDVLARLAGSHGDVEREDFHRDGEYSWPA